MAGGHEVVHGWVTRVFARRGTRLRLPENLHKFHLERTWARLSESPIVIKGVYA